MKGRDFDIFLFVERGSYDTTKFYNTKQYAFIQKFMLSHVALVIVFSLRKVVISGSEMKMVFKLGTWARANLKTQSIRKKFL